jgi:hypothetical protein
LTSTIIHDNTATRPLRAITPRPRPRTWPAADHTPGRRRAARIGGVLGARSVRSFPEIDLARTAGRKAQPGRPVTVSALLARMGGGR